MITKHQVHNLIILDASGSMESIKTTIIEGFNEIVQTTKGIAQQFPDQEHFISLLAFNGLGQTFLHFKDPIEQLKQIDAEKYLPDASTPLYDALGMAIHKLKNELSSLPVDTYNVLVTILTDGEENASKEYSRTQIQSIIETLRGNRWTFTYIGAEHDVEQVAFSLSINNTMKFDKNAADISRMMLEEKQSRILYGTKISLKENTDEDFYKKDKK